MESYQAAMERYMTRQSLLKKKIETYTNSIRDLGVLPEEAFNANMDTIKDKKVRK